MTRALLLAMFIAACNSVPLVDAPRAPVVAWNWAMEEDGSAGEIASCASPARTARIGAKPYWSEAGGGAFFTCMPLEEGGYY